MVEHLEALITLIDGADWVSVFGKNNEDFPKPTTANLASDDGGNFIGKNEWMGLFGNER